jgi:hypothetical protein
MQHLGSPTDLNINDSTLRVRNTTIVGSNTPVNLYSMVQVQVPQQVLQMPQYLNAWFTNPYFGNDILTNTIRCKTDTAIITMLLLILHHLLVLHGNQLIIERACKFVLIRNWLQYIL